MNAYPSIPLQTTLGPVTVHVYGGGEVTISIPREEPLTINRIAYHGRLYYQARPDPNGQRRLSLTGRRLDRADGAWGGLTDNAAAKLRAELSPRLEELLHQNPHLFVQAQIADLAAQIERARRDMAELGQRIETLQEQKRRLQGQLAIEGDPRRGEESR